MLKAYTRQECSGHEGWSRWGGKGLPERDCSFKSVLLSGKKFWPRQGRNTHNAPSTKKMKIKKKKKGGGRSRETLLLG